MIAIPKNPQAPLVETFLKCALSGDTVSVAEHEVTGAQPPTPPFHTPKYRLELQEAQG
jgi:hypothetical protein